MPKTKMDVMFSSSSNEWRTPKWLFDYLDSFFDFGLDACATPGNALCRAFFSRKRSCLDNDWAKASGGKPAFMNPPYGAEKELGDDGKMHKVPGSPDVSDFLLRAYEESGACRGKKGIDVVALVPARTDAAFFHELCSEGSVVLIRSRVHFTLPDGQGKAGAPFPSMLVLFTSRTLTLTPELFGPKGSVRRVDLREVRKEWSKRKRMLW